MNEMPVVEVHIVPSTERSGGVGEPGTPPIAPAVANAVFRLTKRAAPLPFDLAAKGVIGRSGGTGSYRRTANWTLTIGPGNASVAGIGGRMPSPATISHALSYD